MPAPKGNRYWEMNPDFTKPKIFKTPQDLWAAAQGYFIWAELNPLESEKVFSTKFGIDRATIYHPRALTYAGLCLYLGICQETFKNYGRREAYLEVVKKIKGVIYEQKFSGAAAGLLNANIIARDLGLADKSELSGPGGGPIETKNAMEYVDPRDVGVNEDTGN